MTSATPTSARFFLLDAVAGWRGTAKGLAERPGDRALVIDPIPGTAQPPFQAAKASICPPPDPLRCVIAVAADPCAGLIAYDSDGCAIVRVDARTGGTEILRGIGGCGDEVRRFAGASAIALLPDGSFAVAEPDARRVQVFTSDPYALSHVMRFEPRSRPVALAPTPRGNLYVLDAGAGELLEYSLVSGQIVSRLGGGTLKDATAVAMADEHVAVLSGSRVAILQLADGATTWLDLLPGYAYTALAGDGEGSLYTGALANGGWDGGTLRIGLTPKPHVVGFGPLGVTGRTISLTYTPASKLLALVYSPKSRMTTLWSIDPRGACGELGTFESEVFDSRIDRCSWDRLDIEGTLPPGGQLDFESVTADTAAACVWPDVRSALTWTNPAADAVADPEFLVQSAPDRFVRFRLTVRSGGGASPAIDAMRLRYPRQSYLQYLPAVFQEDPESRSFLDRFLSLVQRSFDGFDGRIDRLWTLADPNVIPTEYLPWLAAFFALPLDPSWPDAKRREVLARVFQRTRDLSGGGELSGDYPQRGTRAGLEQSIRDYAGIDDVGIVEHFRLRDWLRGGSDRQLCVDRVWSRDIYQRLQVDAYSRLGYFRLVNQPEPALEPFDWGAHRFSVFFRANPYTVDDTRQRVRQVVERDKPAHTEAVYCPVFPRFRVEYQATVGVDTALAEVHDMVLDKLATLDYDAVLGCGGRAPGGVPPASATLPRADVSTALL